MKKNITAAVEGTATVANTVSTNKHQWQKYHSKQGHGFAAEDANAQWDRWHGKQVVKVGENNAPNGADRISDGVMIQTKYCKSASDSVASAFDHGTYRYQGQKLEVPSDQYEEAVRLMRKRIANGEVPGVTDPNMADTMIIKGHYTYEQAARIAKAGNLDSIKFDVRTQAIACAFSCGLSFAVTYLNAKSEGKSHTEALKLAAKRGAESGACTMVSGVAAQQLLRTNVGRSFAAAATKAVKPAVNAAMKTEAGRKVVEKTASVIARQAVSGGAAANVITKALRTNAVVSTVTFVGTSIPDTIKLCRGKISGRQYAENTVSNAAGVGGGWAGASAGAAIGTLICPGIGTTIGGIIGGLGGGIGASAGIRKLFKRKK